MDEIDDLETELGALETSLGAATQVTAAFSREIAALEAAASGAGQDVGQLSRGLSRGLRRAFDGVIFDGKSLSDALNQVGQSLVNMAYSAAIKPVTDHFGGLLAQGVAGLFWGAFANGASFTQGRVMPFANGGVVSGPTTFPMRGGVGLMGEAGPEAIMPLARGADGKLGVRVDQGAARAVNVTINVTTPDAGSFQRSQGQIAARMARALGRAERNR